MNLLYFLVEALYLVFSSGWRLEGLWKQVLSCYPLVYSPESWSSVVELFCQGCQPLSNRPTP